MRIQKVYKTSKGKFWSLVDANKNRAKTYGSRPGDPVEYETVQEEYVLIADVENYQGVRGIGVEAVAFELTPIQIS